LKGGGPARCQESNGKIAIIERHLTVGEDEEGPPDIWKEGRPKEEGGCYFAERGRKTSAFFIRGGQLSWTRLGIGEGGKVNSVREWWRPWRKTRIFQGKKN